ncbi:putative btb poz domain protein [Diaporthe ampelina]|uniref:Putative btb poz domain protein n=1 Tax=Diaporthe ampelina TaxID=1214573 RepID=A0A0G2FY41_9PEZI|nr:putative btb poz domain protein [Diaporthe ampelina]
MLEFLYCGDYSMAQNTNPTGENAGQAMDFDKLFDNIAVPARQRLCCHLNANAIGDYYDIQPLCKLARSQVKRELEENWSPDDFLHLLTEISTTRKTGDIEFYRLLGKIAAEHLADLSRLRELDDLDMPAAVSMSCILSTIERVRSLEEKVTSLEAQVEKPLEPWEDVY